MIYPKAGKAPEAVKERTIPGLAVQPRHALLMVDAAPVCCRRACRDQSRWRRTQRRAAAALSRRQLVEPGHQPGAGRCSVGAVHRVHQQRRLATASSGLRRLRVAGQRQHLRLPIHGRRRPTSRSGACRSITATRATASITRPIAAARSTRFPTKRSRSRTGSRAAMPGSSDPGGDRHMLIVDRDNRHLYELYDLRWNGSQWTAGPAPSSI